MPRYIDTEKLDEIVQDLNENHDAGITRYKYKLIDAVLWEFPTADVVERKKGKWIDPAADNVYRCSVCEEYTTLEVPRLFYHYCPNCGAEMKGESDGISDLSMC